MAMARVLELLILMSLGVRQTQQQVIHRENFCNGDEVDLECPENTVIRINDAWYMFVYNVSEPNQDCSVHFNQTTLCAFKIEYAHSDAHDGILDVCEGRQRCNPMRANTTILVACRNYRASPPEYIHIGYECVSSAPSLDPQAVRTVTVNHHTVRTTPPTGGRSASTMAIDPAPLHSTSTSNQVPTHRTSRANQSTNRLLTTSTVRPTQRTKLSTAKPGNTTRILLSTISVPSQPPSGGSTGRGTSTTPHNGSTASTKQNVGTKSTITGRAPSHSGSTPTAGPGSSTPAPPPNGSKPTAGPASSASAPPRNDSGAIIPHNGSTSTTVTPSVTEKTNHSQPATHSYVSPSSTYNTDKSHPYTTFSHQPKSPSSPGSSRVMTTSTTPSPGDGQSPLPNPSKAQTVHSSPRPLTRITTSPHTRTLLVTSKSTTKRDLLRTTWRHTTSSTTYHPLFRVTIPRTTTTTSSSTRPSTTQDPQAGGLHLRLAHESLALVIAVPLAAVITITIILAVIIICMRRKKDAKAQTLQEDHFNRVMFYPGHNDGARVATSLDNPTFGLDNQTKIRPAVLTDVDQGQHAYRFNNPSGRLVGVHGAFGGMTSSHRDLRVTLRELEESAKLDAEYSTNPSSRVGYEPLPEQVYTTRE